MGTGTGYSLAPRGKQLVSHHSIGGRKEEVRVESKKVKKGLNKEVKALQQLLQADVLITWTQNGAVVTYYASEPEVRHKVSYTFDDEEDLEGLVAMFYDIRDHIYPGGKRSKCRVQIQQEHGYDYECTDKDCKICAEEKERKKYER